VLSGSLDLNSEASFPVYGALEGSFLDLNPSSEDVQVSKTDVRPSFGEVDLS
jgi:hypothetical protein